MIVTERFKLNSNYSQELRQRQPQFGFGLLGAVTYFRTYSRIKPDGSQETWADTVIRVVEGVMSIRKWWQSINRLPWNEEKWQHTAMEMADAIFAMRFLPPGRGLWTMGTDYIFERGSAALYNCAFVDVQNSLASAAEWSMDMLMCGVGVGFGITSPTFTVQMPDQIYGRVVTITDDREGWKDSVYALIESYEKGLATVQFDYSQIRPAGALITGFGGTASGAEPLIKLHQRIREYLNAHAAGHTSRTRCASDVLNAIGACVVAGNVRRSAEIALGSPFDTEFLNLKDFSKYDSDGNVTYQGTADDRQDIGWMSNNSIVLAELEDFKRLPDIAEMIRNNGEPGVFNLMNIQKFGRYGDVMPDAAVGANPCVTGDTRILTTAGYERIDQLVGKSVEIWNGREWSKVVPRVTGHNQFINRVTFDDGTHLDTTLAHKFHVSREYTDATPTVVEARDLQVGDKLWKYDMPVVEGGEYVALDEAYAQGIYAGDGHFDTARSKPWVYLYGEKKALAPSIPIRRMAYDDPDRDRLLLPVVVKSNDKTFVPFGWAAHARMAWFAGLVDTDGTITKDGNIQITSVEKKFLNDTRLMLTTLGVQAKVTVSRETGWRQLPDGRGGVREYLCQTTMRLLINAADVVKLRELGLVNLLKRIDISNVDPQRDARRFVRVVSIEPHSFAEKVYCFTEEKNGTGTFEGIVTGQCAEIPLESYEVCNLVEVFPTKCATTEEYYKAIELGQLYAHTVSLLPTHRPETNEVVWRNRRIGESLSGVADWFDTAGATEIITLQREGYKLVRSVNDRLAKAAGVPPSVRVTTVKPSGTISLLAGVSPGMHYPPYTRYIRRVRVGQNTPIVPILQNAGIPNEKDVYSDNTLVFEFPVEARARRSQRDISMWQKGAMVMLLQKHWADNMVSNTITFDPKTEGHQIEDFLAHYVPFTKTLSLLPDTDDGQYAQMPYETITKSEFDRRSKEITAPDWTQFGGSDGQDSRFCSNDACEFELPT